MFDAGLTNSDRSRNGIFENGELPDDLLSKQLTLADVRRLVLILALAALFTLVIYLWIYVQTGAWQMLVVMGSVGVGLLLLPIAYILARREKWLAAGYLIVLALTGVYVVSELCWFGATSYIVVGGLLLILLTGNVLHPSRWKDWMVIALLYGLGVFLINRFEPVSRFDVGKSSLLRSYIPGVTIVLVVMTLLQMVRIFRVGAIRTRLLMTSILTVLLTAAAIGASSAVTTFRNGRQQATQRLKLVATLKEVEIDGWVADLKGTLAGSLQQAPEHRYVEPEMAKVVSALLDMPTDSEEYQAAYDLLLHNFTQWLKQTPDFEVVYFVDRNGSVLVSSEAEMEGSSVANEAYFKEGAVAPYLGTPFYDAASERGTIFVSRPILGEYGRLLGVLAGRANLSTLQRVMQRREQAGLGETGEAFLVDPDYKRLTESHYGQSGAILHSPTLDEAIKEEQSGFGLYENYRGIPVVGVYNWLPDLQVMLVAEQEQREAFRAVNETVVLNAGIAAVATLLAAVGSLFTARSIGDPLSDLAETASQIASGDLGLTAYVERRDEIGTLAKAFNSMTVQLRALIGSLEDRVQKRTRDLELRSDYLEASAEVGQVASSILDADELIQAVVDLIRKRFDLYYVGLFLLDESGEWAVLQAGTGKAGEMMLSQNHRLKVGGDSMIGQCVAQSESRIALDVGEEAVRFDNPWLPDTRSEGALPLRSRGRVIGALTVQSAEQEAFDEDIITVLQTMADQVAVALSNAYLFAEREEALQAMQQAYGEMSEEAWIDLLRRRSDLGYRSDKQGVSRAGDIWRPEMERALQEGQTVQGGDGLDAPDDDTLAVPIKVRGNVIGVLDTRKPQDVGGWAQEEIELLELLADQLGQALESARLYQDTQRRAAREQVLGQMTAGFTRSLDLDAVLRSAARELGRLPNVTEASVHIGAPTSSARSEEQDEAGSEADAS